MAPKHTYTILSMMKDEGHSLVEWVAYHNHIGFDNICVYTNNCSDGGMPPLKWSTNWDMIIPF